MWTFLKAWYGADYKIEIKSQFTVKQDVNVDEIFRQHSSSINYHDLLSAHFGGISEKTVFIANGNEEEEPAPLSFNDEDISQQPLDSADINVRTQ